MVTFNFNEDDTSIEIHRFNISPSIVMIWARIVVTYCGARVVLQDQVRLVITPSRIAMIEDQAL